MPPVHIALFRGINVGGKNKLPMKALVALFEDAGCENVRTYIQSGNVVFEASASIALVVPKRVGAAVRREFGVDSPIVMRGAREIATVVKRNPFIAAAVDEKELHVGFLADKPGKKLAAALDPDRSPGDEFVVDGREIYLRFPNGVARSKLTNAWFDATLATTSTMRNWRTTCRLAEMSD